MVGVWFCLVIKQNWTFNLLWANQTYSNKIKLNLIWFFFSVIECLIQFSCWTISNQMFSCTWLIYTSIYTCIQLLNTDGQQLSVLNWVHVYPMSKNYYTKVFLHCAPKCAITMLAFLKCCLDHMLTYPKHFKYISCNLFKIHPGKQSSLTFQFYVYCSREQSP